jgi:hypothetical protein
LSVLLRTGEKQAGDPVHRKTGDEVCKLEGSKKNEADTEELMEGYTGNSG